MAKKPEQTELPGVERYKIAAIERKAKKYQTVRDERMQWTKKEVEARAELLQTMKENNLDVYRFDDGDQVRIVEVVAPEKVRVRLAEDEEGIVTAGNGEAGEEKE